MSRFFTWLSVILLGGSVSADFFELASSKGWAVGQRAHPQDSITLHIFLRHNTTTALRKAIWDVSDPNSPLYGQHWSFETLTRKTQPCPESWRAVQAWLHGNKIPQKKIKPNPAGDILEVVIPVKTAEQLLNASYFRFTSATRTSNVTILRTASYNLPPSLLPHVDLVGPTTSIPTSPKMLRKPQYTFEEQTTAIPEAAFTTPTSIRSRYKATGVRGTCKNNSFAVTGFLDQYFDPSDLAYFFKTYDKASVGRKANIHGPNKPMDSGEEGTLDITYGMSLALDVNTTFWSTAGRQPGRSDNEPFLQWLYDLSSTATAPYVFSISYSDNEDTVDRNYAERVNLELQKAGVRGISIIGSSGDGGVGGTQPDNKCKRFMATFPAASPYITAVGGTSVSDGQECASQVFASGGGFSDWWEQPPYQVDPIATYFKTAKKIPSATLYNLSNAGFPDVSLQAENFALTQYKVGVPVSGTSCSTPSFAGLVALLNDARLTKNKPPLGWLNPLLYSHPEAFFDVTKGTNPGCAVNPSVGYLGEGFPAATGWDPLTGLGTPYIDQWLKIVLSL